MRSYYVYRTQYSVALIEADSPEEALEQAKSLNEFDATGADYEVEDIDV